MAKLNTAIKNLGEKVTGKTIADFKTISETVDEITAKYEKIGRATAGKMGIVKSSNENFKVKVNNDGTMEVNGLDLIYSELQTINNGSGV